MKREKIILNDGTMARVGMIVVVLNSTDRNGNYPGTITKIVYLDNNELRCEFTGYPGKNLYEGREHLRRATPEERKKYRYEKSRIRR